MSSDTYPIYADTLTALLYKPDIPPSEVAAACFDWGRRYPLVPPHRTPRPRGRLRIGYVSGCFCGNPEYFFTAPLLRAHNRSRFEIFCYSNVFNPDRFTRRLRRLPLHWRDISRLSDSEAAQLIRRDGIDLLVDMSGHWGSGRVPLFAQRPAPIQISFPTYPCTTGLPAMDFRITDVWADPPGLSEHLHSEELLRLDRCYCCYEIPQPLPPPGPLPAIRNGYVTFGSFHRPEKLSDELLRLWSAVLRRIPGSRILFHHVFSGRRDVSEKYRRPIVSSFGRYGIVSSRILFAGARPHAEHLSTIARVDIALDSFPYHGMTITCDCLAMGVPVVTWGGRSHVSRTGVSLLKAAGLDTWVATTGEEFIQIAVDHAGDPIALARLRSTLRARLKSSPLTDAKSYAKAIEHLYKACCSR